MSRHENRNASAIAIVACLGALALAGCGGGSSSGSSSSNSSASSVASRVASAASSASASAAAGAPATTASATGSLTPATSSNSASAGAGSVSPASQAYALKLVPLAESWQAAAEHYDTVVGGAGTGNLGLIASSSKDFAAATSKFADQIAALTPPPGVASAQAGLVTAVRALGSDVSELQSAAENRDPSKAADAQSKVGPDGKAVSSAVLALAAAAQKSQ